MNPFFRQSLDEHATPYAQEERIPRDNRPRNIPEGKVAQTFPADVGGVLESSPLGGVGPKGMPQVGPRVDDTPLSDDEIERQIAELEAELGMHGPDKEYGKTEGDYGPPYGDELPYTPDTSTTSEREQILGIVDDGLLAKEGVMGDSTGAASTGKMGLTDAVYKQMKKKYGANITEDEARNKFLGEIYDGWEKKDGWDLASPALKAELIDLGYNAGKGVTKWKGLGGSLAQLKSGLSEDEVLLNILDSANIKGKSSKGLAKRRAESYNQVASNPIAELEQTTDGTIIYRDANGNVVFQYKPKKGVHISSKAGVVPIQGMPARLAP